jgi:Site-specific DNA methylase
VAAGCVGGVRPWDSERVTRPRLLDLFCGAGGAAVGYHRAGFDVFGVDIKPQPNYPFGFICGDALRFPLDGFDAIHASPPCQRYMTGGLVDRAKHPDLIGPTRARLVTVDVPWVIENVPGAPMRPDVLLCGSQFGLKVRRHRWFETSWRAFSLLPPCQHAGPVTGVYGNPHGEAGAWPGMLPSDLETWSRAMGIDWMTTGELADAIPPDYTEFVGSQLLDHLHARLGETA